MRTPLKRASRRQLLKAIKVLKEKRAIDIDTISHVQTIDAQTIESLENENERLKGLLEFYSAGVQSKKMAISECLKTIDALSLDSFPPYGAYSRDVEDTLIKVREILKTNWGQDYGIEIGNRNRK